MVKKQVIQTTNLILQPFLQVEIAHGQEAESW